MSTQCTCVYTVNAFGTPSSALALLIRAADVPVDPAILELTQATVASDTTVTAPTTATRTIVLDLTPGFKAMFPDGTDQTSPFWNFMTGLLQQSARSPIVAAAPVLS